MRGPCSAPRGELRSPTPPDGGRVQPLLPSLQAEAAHAAAAAASAALLEPGLQQLAAAQARIGSLSRQGRMLRAELAELQAENQRLVAAVAQRAAAAATLRLQADELRTAAERLLYEGGDAAEDGQSPPAPPPPASPAPPTAPARGPGPALARASAAAEDAASLLDAAITSVGTLLAPGRTPPQPPPLHRTSTSTAEIRRPAAAGHRQQQQQQPAEWEELQPRPQPSGEEASRRATEARARWLFERYDRDASGRWGFEEARRFVLHTSGTQLDPQEWIAQCLELDADPVQGLTCDDVIRIYSSGLWGADVETDCARMAALESRATELLMSLTTHGTMAVSWRRLRLWPARARALRKLRAAMREHTLGLLHRCYLRLEAWAARRPRTATRSPSPPQPSPPRSPPGSPPRNRATPPPGSPPAGHRSVPGSPPPPPGPGVDAFWDW
eukprot:TRINITY_DN19263_c0_g2_i1.p1 TRINITY_DN19263_c0_g2~~TRINITY_DN19263_c0_g2_i1.p1  ORF type:complete len:443 (+),score=113.00 TRINITY_DN19263_c0_g2_i1:71-1399(+)